MDRRYDREIWRLAVPAFFAIVAEPLFLLADSAIVGHLGAAPLAGLGIAGTVLQTITGLCVFLAYGTTAAVARRIGTGDVRGALTQGIDGIWLAVVIGLVATLGCATLAHPLVRLAGAGTDVTTPATTYLRIAAFGLVPLLVAQAATGIVRGLQDTRTPLVVAVSANLLNIALNITLVDGVHLGIAGSATGSLISQWLAALALLVVVVRGARRQGARLRPHRGGILEAARTGVPLVVRTLALRAALVVTTYSVARLHRGGGHAQAVDLAAHQVVSTTWSTLAFVLEAIEIAAQAIVGRSLGTGETSETRALTRRMIWWGVVVSSACGVLVLATSPWLGDPFTGDPSVRHLVSRALIVIAIAQPLGGVTFILDGILVGAGDGPYLARAMAVSFVVYAPVVLIVAFAAPGAGLVGIWLLYSGLFIGLRMLTLLRRFRTDRWLVAGGTGTVGA